MKRDLFSDDHDSLRESFGRFLDAEVVPHYEAWEHDGVVPREVLRRTGELGFLGLQVDERFGGPGAEDFRFNAVLNEEACRRGLVGFSLCFTMQNDVALPYFLELTTEEQKERWLPGIVSGELVTGIAISEPGTGSDMQAVATRARRSDGGYVVNGAKTFITNGINADLLITVVRTASEGRSTDLSLMIVERDTPGFARGRKLPKIGMKAQDTAELFFDDARVPAENLLGEEGSGFRQLTINLAQERLSIAIGAVASARGALERTLHYVGERHAFGRPIGTFQNSRFSLADCRAEVEVAQAFLDRCLRAHVAGELTPEDAAMAKLWCTEAQGRVIDACLQLHGGYGYIWDYPIARDYADARVTRLYGGTNEIMREIVGRGMGLAEPRRGS